MTSVVVTGNCISPARKSHEKLNAIQKNGMKQRSSKEQLNNNTNNSDKKMNRVFGSRELNTLHWWS
jgi:hypothetical protein